MTSEVVTVANSYQKLAREGVSFMTNRRDCEATAGGVLLGSKVNKIEHKPQIVEGVGKIIQDSYLVTPDEMGLGLLMGLPIGSIVGLVPAHAELKDLSERNIKNWVGCETMAVVLAKDPKHVWLFGVSRKPDLGKPLGFWRSYLVEGRHHDEKEQAFRQLMKKFDPENRNLESVFSLAKLVELLPDTKDLDPLNEKAHGAHHGKQDAVDAISESGWPPFCDIKKDIVIQAGSRVFVRFGMDETGFLKSVNVRPSVVDHGTAFELTSLTQTIVGHNTSGLTRMAPGLEKTLERFVDSLGTVAEMTVNGQPTGKIRRELNQRLVA